MASFTDRMIGAAKLDVETYEEVEADQSAMGQAMGVVVLSSVAAGIGSMGAGGVAGLFFGTLGALVAWLIWAGLTFLIGTKVMPEPQTKADLGELLRTIGFSASPGVLRIFAIIPVVGWLIAFAAGIWMLVAMVVAVRQALDYTTTGKAVIVCVIGFVVYLAIGFIVALMAGLAGAIGGGLS